MEKCDNNGGERRPLKKSYHKSRVGISFMKGSWERIFEIERKQKAQK